jgi:hypothetical protein
VFCSKCGNEAGENQAFCSRCGARLMQESHKAPPEGGESTPVLGKQIAWETVKGDCFRVKGFSKFASMTGRRVNQPSVPFLYALLTVECPKLPGEASILVSNKVDFKHLWELYEERRVGDDEEVLLFYHPLGKKRLGKLGRLMKSFLPCLDILVYPKGHLEEMYDKTFHPPNAIAWFRDRAKWEAAET